MEAGTRRFRPVMLTTITTVGGLMPILLETSLQAQILIPMATSIAFGEMFATVIVLFLVPVGYSLQSSWSAVEHDDHADRSSSHRTATDQPPATGTQVADQPLDTKSQSAEPVAADSS